MTIIPTIMDDFVRPDASTLGPNWSTTDVTTFAGLGISSNTAYCYLSYGQEFWIPNLFGPDCIISFGLSSSLGGALVRLGARMVSPNPGEMDISLWPYPWVVYAGYLVDFSGTTVSLNRVGIDNVTTALALNTAAVLPAAGGAVALRCVGSTITAMTKFSAASPWSTWAEVDDDTFDAAGYAILGMTGTVGGISEFVAGSDDGVPVTARESWGIIAA